MIISHCRQHFCLYPKCIKTWLRIGQILAVFDFLYCCDTL
nr:MAG TPA: hypothetical protein [Crassvirales sp.]